MPTDWDRIAGLLIKNHTETLTLSEQQELNEWLSQSYDNQLLFNELQNKDQVTLELEKLDPAAKQAALEKIRKKIFQDPIAEPVLISNILVRKIGWRQYAAAAVLVGAVAGAYLLFVRRSEVIAPSTVNRPAPLADVAPGRSRATLTLSSGQIVSLDSVANGLVSEQAGAKVMKLDNGQLAYDKVNENPGEIAYNTLTTPKAGQFEVSLPDGTKVWLNNASSLRYPTIMAGSERVVELQGEAYFEVAKKTSAFTVKSGALRVEVLGTNFNLMAYGDEDAVKTTLLQGAVKVVQGANAALLKPGEQGAVDAGGNLRIVKGVDVDEVVAWKNGYFHFASAGLPGVMRQLARWYDVEVEYSGTIAPQAFSGEIQRSLPLSQVLKGLENSQIHFTIQDRKIIVKP